jgi:outer membrane protein OmpA-like peptidoglycan-associated protein
MPLPIRIPSRTLAASLLLALMAGCASTPSGNAPAGTGAAAPVDTGAALAGERKWLASWFKGTPVAIGQDRDGAVTVDVPREFCFDASKSGIKPPLAAVLDKVAESMRRVPSTQLAFVAAPDDGNGSSPLAVQRANQVREYLRGRGVAPVRIGKASASTAGAVQLRIEASPS